MSYGIQLYSLSNYIQKNGLENALQLVEKCGYDSVEFAGFYNLSVNQIQDLLNKYHLKAVSAHLSMNLDSIKDALPYLIKLNIKNVYIAYIGFEQWNEHFDKIIQSLKQYQDYLAKDGIELGYHHHAHEFKDGHDFLEKLHHAIPSLKIELDVCWLEYGHQPIASTFDKYANNLKHIHIKDLSSYEDVGKDVPVIGTGLVDMKMVFSKINQYHLFSILEVENLHDNVESYLKKSLENMKQLQKLTSKSLKTTIK